MANHLHRIALGSHREHESGMRATSARATTMTCSRMRLRAHRRSSATASAASSAASSPARLRPTTSGSPSTGSPAQPRPWSPPASVSRTSTIKVEACNASTDKHVPVHAWSRRLGRVLLVRWRDDVDAADLHRPVGAAAVPAPLAPTERGALDRPIRIDVSVTTRRHEASLADATQRCLGFATDDAQKRAAERPQFEPCLRTLTPADSGS
jgi:hypothetical protein